jgi:leucyl aminopeptidase
MSLTVSQCSPTTFDDRALREVEADVLVVTAGQVDGALELAADAASLGGDLLAQLTSAGFTAAWGVQHWAAVDGRRVLVVGSGPAVPGPRVTLRERRHALAAGVAAVSAGTVAVSSAGWDPLLVEAVVLATYRYDRYASKKRPAQLVITDASPSENEEAELASRVESVCFARDWVSTPAGDKRPQASADLLVAAAQQAGVQARVWSTEELKAAGAGGLIGVGQGSAEPARIVQLTAPGTTDAPPLVLVGKGLTYDAGGVNLKSVWLEHMKLDMGGAAAVAGAVLHAGCRPRARTVVGWIALAENLISSTAYLTGDVLRMHNGTTVEVVNTDAEGRLVMADAMSLADAGGAAAVVTVATLTGAAIRSLGPRTAALMTTDDELARVFDDAAFEAGESLWRMPSLPHYGDGLRSHVADTTNLGSLDGQTMVAAAFLQRFAPAGVPFAHFDLAGPAYNMGEPYDGVPAGGTGYGVRTLVELLDRL